LRFSTPAAFPSKFRERCDKRTPGRSFHRGRREPARSSAPASWAYARSRWSLPPSWSNAERDFTAMRSSVSSASACTREVHTPRFSGKPIKAGDFVLTRTFSRPMRTSCENVGTVSLFSYNRPHCGRCIARQKKFCAPAIAKSRCEGRGSRKAAPDKMPRAHSLAERS